MKLKVLLTRKLGPLPAYAWLGLFTVAVLVYRHFRPGTAAAPATATTTATDTGASTFANGAAGSGGSALTPADGALPPPASDLGTGSGTPVIFDPLTDGYVQPSYVGPDGKIVSPTTYETASVAPLPITSDLVAQPTTYFGKPKPVTAASLPTLKATPPVARRSTHPARPRTAKGRQLPRKATATAAARHAPVRTVAPAPVVAHTAPPLVRPKPRKAVLRPTAQQAHNHGEAAPVRSRTAPAPAPTRRTQSAAAPAAAAPARTAAPAAAPARTAAPAAAPVAAPQLQQGERPQPGKVYAV